MLTNKHLNDLFNYLDQQDRLTRMKLIGSGIVCGLDVSFSENDSITVSKGCGLTSQGFLISFCSTKFTHAIKYNTANFPGHLLFLQQCDTGKTIRKPFYKEEFNDGIFQLLSATQFEDLDSDEKANATAFANNSVIDLKKYVVVLFLEAEEESLKNCDTNDCNDKGSRMDFEVKALLVEKSIIDSLLKEQEAAVPAGNPSVNPNLHHVELRRYNVPSGDLKFSSAVLQEFANLVDDAKLKSIAEVLNYCFIHYYYLLENETVNPFANVWERFKDLRNKILKDNPVLIQYFYDFIDDVLKAYYEFKHKVFEVSAECCGDEMKFPLHLMLGEAAADSASQARSRYRQYFIYSPLFGEQGNRLAEVRLLFTRIKLLISQVDFDSITDFEKRAVRITPSRYRGAYLSDRCIPYHYKVAETGNELYRYWNYEKTRRGNERFNLGYDAAQYSAADNIVHPLLYDIERFDFFRIEGHIGKHVTTAMSLVKSIQLENNVAFDTVALSADYIGALVRGEEPKCTIEDLQSDYRVLIAEFICKVHDAYCFVARLPFVLPVRIVNFTALTFARATTEDATAIKSTLAFNPSVLEKLSHPFASRLVNEFQAIKKYIKGGTLSKLCNPPANTIGAAYIQMKGRFANPVSINTDQPATAVQFHAFEFIDSVESMLELVMNFELGDLDIDELKSRNDRFEKEVRTLSLFAIAFLQKLESNDNTQLSDLAADLYLDLLIFNLEMLLHLCFVEQLEALKNEYLRRMAQYRLAKNFSYYWRLHPGIEHKAGVPAGGTFIMVYSETIRNRLIDKNSLFVVPELANLMLANFRDIIQPDVSLDTLTNKTKLLKTALLYKDPALYANFKEVLTRYLDDCKDLPDATREELTAVIVEEPQMPRFELQDGTVIADFYVPYICCSDCPPVAYILPVPPKDEVKKPTLTIEDKPICSGSAARTRLFPNPALGTFTVDGAQKDECFILDGNAYFFVPRGLAAGTHAIVYTVNGKSSDPLIVTITLTPVAKFRFEPAVVKRGDTIRFTNETVGAATFGWKINDEVKSTEKDFNYTVTPNDQSVVVVLVAFNGVCQDATKPVEIPIQGDVTKSSLKLCRSTKEFPLETGLPNMPNAVIIVHSNSGIKMSEENLIVRPSATDTTNGNSFVVAYSIDGQEKEVTIEIALPNPDFIIRIRKDSSASSQLIVLELESKDKSYNAHQWAVSPALITGSTGPYTDDPQKELRFTPAGIREADGKKISIDHTVVINTDSGECRGKAHFDIPVQALEQALNKAEFDNHFVFAGQ